ncbi:chemotaxis protein CheW [Microbulbifer hydrolyticus]|uniref:Chemotaxis protein CheW n=1 Tax=Microbulbifer hydrolyticus TaxID=48074 RepID=A0A6P1TFW4_9GAMM|nr:chemotaxis protein CheW [Microbulbifer hydrolyticus]MBB5213084.1 twitching motility protein PilI [Microbulbifer hydrolyticus]QHQ40440.1 chemotaxis protein CheW [Microbulbifer hydrolyticus]
MHSTLTPYLALVDIANRAKAQAQGLPARQEVKPYWTGIGFSLLGHRFVASMEDVVELLELPQYTFIPGAQPWVRGVANVRGRLLPLFDMAAFFGGHLSSARQRRRVLVVEYDKVYAGLIVDELHGMQHLALEYGKMPPSDLVEAFAPMVSGQFQLQQERWLVFDLQALLSDFQFADAAAH